MKRGPAPSLTDIEVLTMLMVGEYLGLGSDKKFGSASNDIGKLGFRSLDVA
jgi:hypothetical protein